MTSRPSLHFHEWISVISLIIVLSFFTLISHSCESSNKEMGQPHYLKDHLVEIYISGAVENPGPYQVPHGTTVAKALELAKTAPTANLKKLKLESKITRSRHIKVTEQKPPKKN